ncbi:pre-rRNA-processing esf1 [Fusarium tjaetaba]|uniref:Pre-rRNA-processing esf1 n=1 Tax=Fusarium tjaetaba TaxID=1567544 RepID=A0A8H5R9J1_9HYPO|nr:pre-rRNA-processing esf1 [Fusarium tjaetaba]KAF5629040.1 pre-rRNA-processing esf1 [Fusarium tjaetaba]
MKNDKKTKKSAPAASQIADKRFADFETDPRFRLPSKKQTKTTIDKRFSRMLKDDEFTATAKVDRYGRKVKSDSKKKALQRLYREEDEDEDEDEEEEGGEEEDIEVDDDEVVQRELRKAHEKYDPARGGGFSSSEDDSDSEEEESDSDEEEGGAQVDTEGDMQRFQDEQNDVEAGEVTNRIAIVNLDWDHVKSTDLMALFNSFLLETGGKIEKISVYPSEFGKERMQQEEVEGPPKELFKNSKNDSDDDSDDSDEESEDGDERIKKSLLQEGDDQDFDSDALRSYQLDRLRYYYAVMVCSSPAVAQKLYEAVDGREYQSSSNFLDLRFVPDDVTFDDEPRDECEKVPESYKPVEFVTNALQSSKVKLTWDMHPEEASRKESINRAFSGSRNEIEENDLRAYLASDSEDDDVEEEEVVEEKGEDEPKLSKKELARRKMRAALGLSEEPTKSSKNVPVGDMEITFTPALSESAPKKTAEEETTIEKYIRKEKERKEKKREAARARRAGQDPEAEEEEDEVVEAPEGETDDLGFDDPFFTAAEDPAASSKTSIRKADRLKKREAREAAEAESKAQKQQLEKVMANADADQADHLDHFDMNEIVRAEKAKKKKGKAKKKALAKESRGGLQEDFSMDVDDDRFKAVFESHEYAIDPSNPKFKATEGMQKLLEEGRKKRRNAEGGDEEPSSKKAKKGRR